MTVGKLRELGERGFLRLVNRLLEKQWGCRELPPGDDAACARAGGSTILLKIDGGSIAGMRLPWMTLYHVGWKSVVAAASDLIAKGARPVAFLLSLGLPPSMGAGEALDIIRGAIDAAGRIGAWIAGGDTNAARDPWIDVAGIGEPLAKPIGVDAKPGDLLYTTVGRYGLTGLAFQLYRSGRWEEIRNYPEAYRATTTPEPRLEFLTLVDGLRDCITWASDVSDGFCATLERLRELTGLEAVLERLPSIHAEAAGFASREGIDPRRLLLEGGEEYEIVFTLRRDCEDDLLELAARHNITIQRIGFIIHVPARGDVLTSVEGRPIDAEQVRLIKAGELCVRTGWDQFKGWI